MNAAHDHSAVLVVPSARELARRLPLGVRIPMLLLALLGGSVGVGAVLLAFGIGPVTHRALAPFHRPVAATDVEAALRAGEVHGE